MSETYEIAITASPINWEEIKPLSVATYSWNCAYRPQMTAKAAFVPNEGFYVKTCCQESDPRATYTEPNSPVCRDSCMEFFAAFDTAKPEVYVNYEINANGCALAQFGTSDNRPFLDPADMPTPTVTRTEDSWGWELFIPLTVLNKLFGEIEYKAGSVIRANVFKCGDDTASPHYGSWQPIDWPYPSFHRPQFFGEMRLA